MTEGEDEWLRRQDWVFEVPKSERHVGTWERRRWGLVVPLLGLLALVAWTVVVAGGK